ncbi:MAG TPA: phage tail sheath subtilisin-like domain-containing protein, partial [Phycisphaerae bacterium]|nr:phage tail sheath subtilisin-like domain-containing protein [Phycisphaerae bacterium]
MALAGIETLHPDVFVIEERGVPRIVGVGVNTGGFVGEAERGATDRVGLITNLTQFSQQYGSFFEGSFLEPSVRAFFDQGGTRCFVVRVVGAGALAANTALVNHEGGPAIEVDASSAGAYGNNVSLVTEVWRTVVAASPPNIVVPPVGTGSFQIPVSSLRNIRTGDLVVIEDSTGTSGNTVQAFVYNIDVGNRLLIVRPLQGLPVGFTFPVGSRVRSASDHRSSTTIVEDLVNGATQVRLQSTANLTIGARLYFDNGQNFASVVVTAVDGSVARFAPVSISAAATLPAFTTIAVSQEWRLQVFDGGSFRESFDGLSMEPSNTRDYFVIRLSGESNESRIIEASDLFPAVADLNKQTPLPVSNQFLANGTNGATPTDADYIGSDSSPLSGVNLLGAAPELNFFSVPGITTVEVSRFAADFADRSGRLVAVLDAPLADDEPLEVLNFRNIEANFDTSYAALYYPWVIVRDPNVGISGNSRFTMPPSGHVQGKYAEVGATRGVHFAPANIALRGVLDLTYNVSDGEHDLLNPAGVNVIRGFPGEGIRIMGGRTLTSFLDGRHYVNVRRYLNFI